jgi:hypothetical protein
MAEIEPTPDLMDAMQAVAENRVRMDVDLRRFLISSRIIIGSFYADDSVTNALFELQEEGLVRFGVGGRLGVTLVRDIEPSPAGAEWLARAEQESKR